MKVLIIARTKWGEYCCVSGIELDTNRYIRLLDKKGGYMPQNVHFKIGTIWDLDYTVYVNTPPHVEDVRVSKGTFVENIPSVQQYIIDNCLIWEGSPFTLFDSKLKWENGSGYLDNTKDLPRNSVGFWIPDKDLILYKDVKYNNEYYIYETGFFQRDKRLKYKGFEKSIDTIKSGTIVRVSLAKWWSKDNQTEKRCYLQLSGWYQ